MTDTTPPTKKQRTKESYDASVQLPVDSNHVVPPPPPNNKNPNLFPVVPGLQPKTNVEKAMSTSTTSKRLYQELLQSNHEPLLQVDDMQGDCILGFNKRFTRRLVLNLKEKCKDNPTDEETIIKTKMWLKSFATTGFPTPRRAVAKISSLKDILDHREKRNTLLDRDEISSIASEEQVQNTVFCNICFSYHCLGIFLSKTLYETTMRDFGTQNPFVIGSTDRGTLLGDSKYMKNFQFGKKQNDDILINIASDSEEDLNDVTKTLKCSFADILDIVNDTISDRGIKENNGLYGHEHFGFQDGLSQPSVRGVYSKDNHKKEFIVRRNIRASDTDKRYLDYSRPGFRLCDAGHFILGQEYLENISDDIDPRMSNPNPDVYRTLKGSYPDWCKGGSYAVYRKIEQDVPLFWETCLEKAKELTMDKPMSDDELKKKAGMFGAKMIGRWWDGTPLITAEPCTGFYYPPTKEEIASIKDVKVATAMDGIKNGFQFNSEEKSWTLRNGCKTPAYKSDQSGTSCPFAAHIRKVNPRDEFTDIGSDLQTLKHRIIRRGNNYGPRVNDVFNPTCEEKIEARGLSLVMYMASIDEQFEFLQRNWANSNTRPKDGGDDMIIGLPSRSKKEINIPSSPDVSIKLDDKKVFTFPIGMGYFILPPISAITDVITSMPISTASIVYDVPAGKKDFSDYQTLKLWDWTVETVFWQSIWNSASQTMIVNGGQTSVPGFTPDSYPQGIAYRLPDPKMTAKVYIEDSFSPTDLQFRSTKDVKRMAGKLGGDQLANKTISWEGFPKRLLDLYKNSEVNPYQEADKVGWPPKDLTYRSYTSVGNARQMDEYCEWFTHRNEDGKITRIDITCESPEYWSFLVKNRPDVALELYQKYVSPNVTLDSLLDENGEYNIYNEWNTEKGAMHLNCPPNSLFAEIYIAAEAATRWGNCANGMPLTNGGDLIGCASYGLSTRASDPTIGKNCNDLIRGGKIISIADPVGLYLEELNTTGWLNNKKKPFSKAQINQIVQYVRQSPRESPTGTKLPKGDKKLRIQVQIPDHYGYVLGDCFIGGAPLEFAGQLVDSSVTVFLNAIAVDGTNKKHRFLTNCVDKAIVPCRDVWGTKGTDGKIRGPQRNLVNPLVNAPELEESSEKHGINVKWNPRISGTR